jgi:hypothetical protein
MDLPIQEKPISSNDSNSDSDCRLHPKKSISIHEAPNAINGINSLQK